MPDQLTERQREIVELVAEGKTNPSIAGTLGISVYTVRSHLRSIRQKLQVQNRVQLAVWYAKASGRSDHSLD